MSSQYCWPLKTCPKYLLTNSGEGTSELALKIPWWYNTRITTNYSPQQISRGQYANSNAQLVKHLATMAEGYGRPLATPSQAREMLGLEWWSLSSIIIQFNWVTACFTRVRTKYAWYLTWISRSDDISLQIYSNTDSCETDSIKVNKRQNYIFASFFHLHYQIPYSAQREPEIFSSRLLGAQNNTN